MLDRFLMGTGASFTSDRSGNVAVIFGLSLMPMVMFVGASIDYSQAISVRSRLQHAADSAVLAAGLTPSGTLLDAQTAGTSAFNANFPSGGSVVITKPAAEPGVIVANASATVDTSFLKAAGFNSISISSLAKAKSFANATAIEVALVLDNTGSMINDMVGLKAAATSLTNTLFQSAGSNTNFKMSLVPYVAAVNPGKTLLSSNGYAMMDTTADSWYHGGGMRWAYIATNYTTTTFNGTTPSSNVDCQSVWGGSSGGAGSGGGSDKKTQIDILEPISKFANELLGIKSAHAFNETPNTSPVLSGVTNVNSTKGFHGGGEFVPTGFSTTVDAKGAANSGQGCDWLQNPGKINYFDLFNRIPTITKSGSVFGGWKGCVEARAEPYDATDDPPGLDPAGKGIANTRFTPYFAADESDPFASWTPVHSNNWLDDGYLDPTKLVSNPDHVMADPTGVRTGRSDNNKWDFRYNDWSRTRSVLKYNSTNIADIKDYVDALGNHITTGPNANCPDEIQPLTNNKSLILSKINSLQTWSGGGTITSEGLAWGWRSISPNLPFALGSGYDAKNVQKVIVLMTDGRNDLVNNDYVGGYGPIISEYTAYGYLADGRMGSTFAAATTYLNNRLTATCTNAKAKPGVSIYTVLFRETDTAITNLLKSCASTPDKAFTASNAAGLAAAFAQIGGSISQLRLTE